MSGSGSENRQRTAFLAIRLDPSEEQWIEEQAGEAGITKSELARALIFGREPARRVVPCNDNHVGCSQHHRNQVDGYRDERYRQEQVQEDETAMYRGDLGIWRENGGRLVTFGDWLRAHKV